MSDTLRHEADHVDRLYRLHHSLKDVYDGIVCDTSFGLRFNREFADVTALQATTFKSFLVQMIQKLKTNTYFFYKLPASEWISQNVGIAQSGKYPLKEFELDLSVKNLTLDALNKFDGQVTNVNWSAEVQRLAQTVDQIVMKVRPLVPGESPDYELDGS